MTPLEIFSGVWYNIRWYFKKVKSTFYRADLWAVLSGYSLKYSDREGLI